ncbi:MAG TPA: NAD(P)/FAD-dependent oxidoreductase [Candidatus Baltobacteraceae bacterium]
MQSFDVVVVGTGSAGNGVAHACREAGRSVAIVDELPFGGTCQLRGCDPKKVLVGAATLVDWGNRMAKLGVIDRAPALQWSDLMRFKRTFTDPVPAQREKGYKDAGIATFHARARFVDEETLDAGGERLRAKHIVLATGATPAPVAPGDELLLTSTDFLDLDALPARIVFVGGGYISFEFAHVAARAGANVQIVHGGARPLEHFDPDLVDRLVKYTRDLGVAVHLETEVTKIERRGAEIVVSGRSKRDAGEREFVADAAVHGAGRMPNLDGLNLEAGNVMRGKRGVTVNEYLQSTSNPRVYAAGDSADGGGAPLTPVAGDEGETVAANLLHGNVKTMSFDGLTSCVYTIPTLATVGLGEAEAKEQGITFDVHAGDMTGWYSSRRLAERAAAYKMLLEKQTGRILGAHILGSYADEQINVLALAIRHRMKAKDIAEALFAYPSGASDLQYMIE